MFEGEGTQIGTSLCREPRQQAEQTWVSTHVRLCAPKGSERACDGMGFRRARVHTLCVYQVKAGTRDSQSVPTPPPSEAAVVSALLHVPTTTLSTFGPWGH